MKIRTRMLVMLTCCMAACASFAQTKDPNKEILVFFKEGIKNENKLVSGRSTPQPLIKSERLRISLSRLGLNESSIEIANVRFKEADTLKVLQDGSLVSQANMTKLYRIKVKDSKSREGLIQELNKLPEVLYAEQNFEITSLAIPNDPGFGDQWGFKNPFQPGSDIHAEAAWDIFKGSPDNIIAIMDHGVDVTHPDLKAKIVGSDPGFSLAHGTHVAGIAAASTNNGIGTSGVDWNAKILPKRVDVGDNVELYNNIIDAINFSPNVTVLNNSWGIGKGEDIGKNSLTVQQAFAYIYKANRTAVVAMGNHQDKYPDLTSYPAGYDNVIAVGSTNWLDRISPTSTQGNHIDVSAPGVGILSTDTLQGYGTKSGTSMATPVVSGIASLLKGYNSNLFNDDIENIIKLSADDRGDVGFDKTYGAGRVNAERALRLLIAPNTLNQWNATGGSIASSTGNYSIMFLSTPGIASGTYSAKRHEVTKTVTFPNSFCQITGAWGRGVGTTGWSAASPNFGMGYAEVVPGTLTNTGATLRTYVYEVWNVLGQSMGFFPTAPAYVNFAYTVLGTPNISATMSGASAVCTDGNRFRLNNVPAGVSIVWSASSNISIDNTGFAYATTDEGATGWVRAVLNGVCGNPVISKNVWVGNIGGTGGIRVGGNAFPSPSGLYQYSLSSTPQGKGAISYRWRVPSGNGWEIQSDNTDASSINVWVGSSAGSVEAYWSNQCGEETGTYIYVRPAGSGGGGGGGGPGPQPLRVFPNPANTDLTISISETDNSKSAIENGLETSQNSFQNYDIKLLNKFSKVVRTGKSKDGKFVINVKDLSEGVYILKINYSSWEETKQVIIRH